MMHERKKSDPAIVAVKSVNKAPGSKPGAEERMEPRAGAKRNASQQSTDRTQCREAVSQAQARIREAVTRNPKEKLTALLHHITVDALGAAFFSLKPRAAVGVDQVRWSDYAVDRAKSR
jgi:RNA-directed DNA polymerase